MKTLCIYYDLNHSNQQYRILISYLETFQSFTQAGDRIWFINTNKDCSEIRTEIDKLPMQDGYKSIVFEVGKDWSAQGIQSQTADWMKKDWTP